MICLLFFIPGKKAIKYYPLFSCQKIEILSKDFYWVNRVLQNVLPYTQVFSAPGKIKK